MGNETKTGMIAILTALLAAAGPGLANNLALTNTLLRAPVAGKVEVQLDISWDNSWKDGVNRDAAWVFVKYSIDSGATWSHATLGGSGTNPAGFSGGTGTNLDVVVPADKKGAFIQRAVNGTGTVSNRDVKLVWDFATNGVSRSKSALVKVFAIEMVYVPEGSFYLGSGGGEGGHFYRHDGTAQTTTPYQVLSETNAISVGSSSGRLYYTNIGATVGDGAGVISNAFPKGYAAFYMMKTEISQRQYCDFLNTLTATQQASRHDTGLHFNNARNFIKKTDGSPAVFGCDANNNAGPDTAVTNVAKLNESADGEWVACTWFSWADGTAYAAWAALRPFTELEFEKACRGPLAPVPNEYAWGDATLELPFTTSLVNAATSAEAPNQGNCNYDLCSPNGPFRCGSYADASSGRASAGAGYYGILDLSGNLWDRSVTVGNQMGRRFTGLHGDGALTAEGNANVEGWPENNGSGIRGGDYSTLGVYAGISDRYRAVSLWPDRYNNMGGRAARSEP